MKVYNQDEPRHREKQKIAVAPWPGLQRVPWREGDGNGKTLLGPEEVQDGQWMAWLECHFPKFTALLQQGLHNHIFLSLACQALWSSPSIPNSFLLQHTLPDALFVENVGSDDVSGSLQPQGS